MTSAWAKVSRGMTPTDTFRKRGAIWAVSRVAVGAGGQRGYAGGNRCPFWHDRGLSSVWGPHGQQGVTLHPHMEQGQLHQPGGC